MMHQLNWVDMVILGVMVLSVLVSIVRGFVRETLSLASWIGAVWVGVSFMHAISPWFKPYVSSTDLRTGIAFALLFMVALFIGSIISYIVVQLIQKSGLSGTDRSLGIVFGLGRGVLIVSVGLLVATMVLPKTVKNMTKDMTTSKQRSALKSSQLAPYFNPVVNWLQDLLPMATRAPDKIEKQSTDTIEDHVDIPL